MAGKFWDKGPMVVTGCTKVSEGCRDCWSEQAHVIRSKGPNSHIWPSDCLTDGRFNGKVHFNLDALKNAVKGRKPKVIAVWNDLYHEGVTDEQIKMFFRVARSIASHHTLLIITKRPERAAKIAKKMQLCDFFGDSWARRVMKIPFMKEVILNHPTKKTDNIWHIATMENQDMADERMPHLLQIPGKRGIIIEPMLGSFQMSRTLTLPSDEPGFLQEERGFYKSDIHQVILGGETGKDARPMHPDWVRSIRDQCAAAGVPFFFKSWGEWLPKSHWTQEMRKGNWQRLEWGTLTEDGTYFKETSPFNGHDDDGHGGEAVMVRVGKKKAGRLLDGREHNDLAWRI